MPDNNNNNNNKENVTFKCNYLSGLSNKQLQYF